MLALAQAVSLCAAAPSQSGFEQGYPIPAGQVPAGYNHAGRYAVQGWDFFLQGSFIYWQSSQDGMDIATSVNGSLQRTDSHLFSSDFAYSPGFKVRTGWNTSFDDWTTYAEYTWFRGSSHTTTSAPTGLLLLATDWLNFQGGPTATAISSHWRPHLDLLDVHVTRPYYQGTKLTVSPYAGLRAAWIRQSFRVAYDTVNLLSQRVVSHNHSYSWGIGPRAGFLFDWLLGMGFKVTGEANGSILYTRYTKVTNRQDSISNGVPLVERLEDYGCLRPNTGVALGLAWGRYFDQQKYHLDFAASYEWSAFWSQNMMRVLTDSYLVGTGYAPSALFLQGLTASLRFDF